MNRELLPTSGIRAGLSAITPAFVLPYLFQAAWLPAHRQCAFLLPQPGHALFSFKRLFEVTGWLGRCLRLLSPVFCLNNETLVLSPVFCYAWRLFCVLETAEGVGVLRETLIGAEDYHWWKLHKQVWSCVNIERGDCVLWCDFMLRLILQFYEEDDLWWTSTFIQVVMEC